MTPPRRPRPARRPTPAPAGRDRPTETLLVAPDLIASEVAQRLDQWSVAERRLFQELLEDARTELQRELLRRAVAAGHPVVELHAFAHALRPLRDAEAYAACTLTAGLSAPQSVVQRLRAEADPLYGYQLNGHRLSPRAGPVPLQARPPQLRPVQLIHFPPRSPQAAATSGADEAHAATLLSRATRRLGLSWIGVPVDRGSLRLEEALEGAAAALDRGTPVPVGMGTRAGATVRYGLLLQVERSGSIRAFQLYDPMGGRVVWLNEEALLARADLRLGMKVLRRITSVALPRA